MQLEIAHGGILVRFEDGSSVSFDKNGYDQYVEGEYAISGGKTSDEVHSMRGSARQFVFERGLPVVLH